MRGKEEMQDVKWHVKDKPSKDGFYLVTTVTGKVRCIRYYAYCDMWDTKCSIIAWAELPEGYKHEAE